VYPSRLPIAEPAGHTRFKEPVKLSGYALLFSGGKESTYALVKAHAANLKVNHLICTIYDFPRPSPHTLNMDVVEKISEAVGVPLIKNDARGKDSREALINTIKNLHVEGIIAGDVFVEEHRKWLESICGELGLQCVEPLWGMNTKNLLREEVNYGLRPLIVGVQTKFIDASWLGIKLDPQSTGELISLAEKSHMDPCGEHGEYHTLVVEGKPLRKAVKVSRKNVLFADGYGLLRLSV